MQNYYYYYISQSQRRIKVLAIVETLAFWLRRLIMEMIMKLNNKSYTWEPSANSQRIVVEATEANSCSPNKKKQKTSNNVTKTADRHTFL